MAYMPNIRCAAMNCVEGSDITDKDVIMVGDKLVKRCGNWGFVKIGGKYFCRAHATVIRNHESGLSAMESDPAFNVDVVLPQGVLSQGTVIPGRGLLCAGSGRPTADRCVKQGTLGPGYGPVGMQ